MPESITGTRRGIRVILYRYGYGYGYRYGFFKKKNAERARCHPRRKIAKRPVTITGKERKSGAGGQSQREKKKISKMLRGRAHVTAAHDSKDRERSLKREDNGYIPAVVDVVASIAVVGEASTEARIVGELPDRIGLFATDTGDPTGTELHRHASETFFSDPPADSVRSLQNHHVLYPVLCQHLRRRYSFQQKTKKKKTQKQNQQKYS